MSSCDCKCDLPMLWKPARLLLMTARCCGVCGGDTASRGLAQDHADGARVGLDEVPWCRGCGTCVGSAGCTEDRAPACRRCLLCAKCRQHGRPPYSDLDPPSFTKTRTKLWAADQEAEKVAWSQTKHKLKAEFDRLKGNDSVSLEECSRFMDAHQEEMLQTICGLRQQVSPAPSSDSLAFSDESSIDDDDLLVPCGHPALDIDTLSEESDGPEVENSDASKECGNFDFDTARFMHRANSFPKFLPVSEEEREQHRAEHAARVAAGPSPVPLCSSCQVCAACEFGGCTSCKDERALCKVCKRCSHCVDHGHGISWCRGCEKCVMCLEETNPLCFKCSWCLECAVKPGAGPEDPDSWYKICPRHLVGPA
jgi:hypothetical protein